VSLRRVSPTVTDSDASLDPAIGELIRRADDAAGAGAAADELFTLLYHELHRLAERHLRRSGSNLTLGTTTLLHEAYLRLADQSSAKFESQGRFLAYASRAMRRLVIDYSRRQRALKRGGEFHLTSADGTEASPAPAPGTEDLDRLNDGLELLARADSALAELVDLHFFAGFSLVDIARLRGVSERTAQRDWHKARLLLFRAVQPDDGESESARHPGRGPTHAA
jgi:RNA polymerase sigma factor (TIGR02999 family)